MDLKKGEAVILPEEGRSFDLAKVPEAIKKAGFTPGEIVVTAVGTLAAEGDLLRLEMPGSLPQMVLADGAKAEELRKRRDLIGRRLRVSGTLHPSHAGQPPGISVDSWTVMSSSTGE